MSKRLRILIIEDSPDDFILTTNHLAAEGLEAEYRRVVSTEEIASAADEGPWDVVLSDYNIRPADFMECYGLVRERLPYAPVIVLSGTVGEDRAVDLMKLGACDFVLKDRLWRLVPAIKRALRESADRRAREDAEQTLIAKEQRYLAQRNALITLTTRRPAEGVDLHSTFRAIAEAGAETLGVERVGIWRFDEKRTAIHCVELFERSPRRHSAGRTLAITTAPTYFRALGESDVIAADDVWTDQRTVEFGDYHIEAGITSMMDAAFRCGGGVEGVICYEHAGPPRVWTSDEQAFAVATANLISLALEESERRRAEVQLQERAARLRLQSAALNASANSVVITDREGTIVWANPAFSTLTGYSAEEAIGRNPRALVRSGLHDDAFYKRMWDTILSGESWHGEMTNRRKDGSLYPEALTITPVRDEGGEIRHFIAIKSDLTEKRRMDEQFRQAHRLEAVGQLAGGIAHEFNNLLQALLAMATTLRMRTAGTELQKIGSDIETQIMRGAGLTSQLLQFSRRRTLEVTRFDLGDLVRREAVMMRRLIPETIRLQVDAEGPSWVEGDPGQLQQVLMNLVLNARDAMPDGGSLDVRLWTECGELCLEVTDSGRGMDDATRLRIFEPFFTTKGPGKGTGLGLSVVLGIIQQHGGRIEVDSAPAAGTRMRIVLAAAQDADVRQALPQEHEAIAEGHGELVLLVEDEEVVRDGVRTLLEVIGYEVVTAASAEEVEDTPPARAPRFLLSDVTLPGMSGIELASRMRSTNPELRVVLMSGYTSEEMGRRMGDGRSTFLQKPFELADLARALQSLGPQTGVVTQSNGMA